MFISDSNISTADVGATIAAAVGAAAAAAAAFVVAASAAATAAAAATATAAFVVAATATAAFVVAATAAAAAATAAATAATAAAASAYCPDVTSSAFHSCAAGCANSAAVVAIIEHEFFGSACWYVDIQTSITLEQIQLWKKLL